MADGALAGRVALVTGASGGIGAAIAAELGEAGAAVALAYGSRAEPVEALRERLAARGARVAVAGGGDLADPATAPALLAGAEAALGPVDVLVPNAGLGVRRELGDVDLALWDATLAVNLRAPFQLVQGVVPGMRERGWGRILLLSSVAAFTGGRVGPHYAASKAGLHGLLGYLAGRLAGDGITVNALAPALIERTEMLPGDPGDLAAHIPAGRLGTPEEVAALARTVIANGYVTGQVIGIDGGMHPRT
jgi:3-oxoacyl-[acyl-carrier protein] reductase